MKQCTILIAKADFNFRMGGKGRPITVRAGQRFWVVSTALQTKQEGIISICREGKGGIGQGWTFTSQHVGDLFATED